MNNIKLLLAVVPALLVGCGGFNHSSSSSNASSSCQTGSLGCPADPLQVTLDVAKIGKFGENLISKVTVTGGIPPYHYDWTGCTEDKDTCELKPELGRQAMYVTVTDSSSFEQSKSVSSDFTVTTSGTISYCTKGKELQAINDLLDPLPNPNSISVDTICENGRITQLSIMAFGPQDFTLRDNFSPFKKLEALSIIGKYIGGTLPASIGQLQNLKSLVVFSASVSGQLPPEMSNLTQLNYLYIALTNIGGKLPITFLNNQKLSMCQLSANLFCSENLVGLDSSCETSGQFSPCAN